MKGNAADSIADLRRAVGYDPGSFDANISLGRAYYGIRDVAAAARAFEAAVRLRPDDVSARFFLATSLERNGELYEARIALGRTLVRQGKAAEAVDHLKAAARLAPENPEPRYQLAMAYRKLGRRAESAAEFREVQRLNEERRKKGKVSGGADPQ